jgi:hypothetical protein
MLAFRNIIYMQQKTSLEVGFEFLTAVVMKSSVFRDITPCSPVQRTTSCYISQDRTQMLKHWENWITVDLAEPISSALVGCERVKIVLQTP